MLHPYLYRFTDGQAVEQAATVAGGYDKPKRRRILIGNKQFYVTDAELAQVIEAELRQEPAPIAPEPAKESPKPKAKAKTPQPEKPAQKAEYLDYAQILASLKKQQETEAIALLQAIARQIEEEEDDWLLMAA